MCARTRAAIVRSTAGPYSEPSPTRLQKLKPLLFRASSLNAAAHLTRAQCCRTTSLSGAAERRQVFWRSLTHATSVATEAPRAPHAPRTEVHLPPGDQNRPGARGASFFWRASCTCDVRGAARAAHHTDPGSGATRQRPSRTPAPRRARFFWPRVLHNETSAVWEQTHSPGGLEVRRTVRFFFLDFAKVIPLMQGLEW